MFPRQGSLGLRYPQLAPCQQTRARQAKVSDPRQRGSRPCESPFPKP